MNTYVNLNTYIYTHTLMGHMGLACWRLPFLFFWFEQVQSLLLRRLSITILRDACQRPSKFQSSYSYSGKHTLPRAINKHCTSTLNPVCHQIYELWNFDYLWHPPLRITFGSLLGRFFLWEPLRQGQRSKVQSLTAKAKGWQRSACTKTRSNTLSKWWILWSTYDAFEFFFPNMLSINYFPWFFFGCWSSLASGQDQRNFVNSKNCCLAQEFSAKTSLLAWATFLSWMLKVSSILRCLKSQRLLETSPLVERRWRSSFQALVGPALVPIWSQSTRGLSWVANRRGEIFMTSG